MGSMCNQLLVLMNLLSFFVVGFYQLYLACSREESEWKIEG